MNTRLKILYDRLEDDRKRLMIELAKASSEKLFLRPSKSKWSVNEILTHLVASEQLTLRYIKKKSLGVDELRNSGFGEKIRYAVLKVSQRLPLKYKAPENVVLHTPGPLELSELNATWNNARKDLEQFLDSITDVNVRKLIYKHPVAGRFDIIQCLKFMREHYLHHLPQIKRLL